MTIDQRANIFMPIVPSPLTGSATAWWIAGDHARESQTAEVQSEFVVVVFAYQFGMHLGHTVDCLRPLDGHVGSGIPWTVRSKSTDRARYEYPQFVLFCQFDHIVQAFDVDSHRQRNVLLADGTEQRTEVDDPIDAVIDDDLLQTLKI